MDSAVPARLHVLLARQSEHAVIIRRGPSKHAAVIGWDRKTDTFTLGQWLRGRIYERRCDLSPDGEHLIYFAMNGQWKSKVRGSWTAISRAPYLKAVTLFAKGDCWNGGGLFRDNGHYWLNDGPYTHALLWEDRDLVRIDDASPGSLSECPGVYYERLVRDGWTAGDWRRNDSGGALVAFDKPISDRWLLRKYAHATSQRRVGRGCYFDTHELIDRRSGEAIVKEDWEWADVDRGRLVWAADGRLGAIRIDAKGRLGSENVLRDFNAMKFERLTAPY